MTVEESRERVAACLGAEPSKIVFTSGGTESDNLAIKGVLDAASSAEESAGLITSAAEHKAVLEPARRLQEQGHPVTILDPKKNGAVSPGQVEAAIDDRMALVSLMHVNNENGRRAGVGRIVLLANADFSDYVVLGSTDTTQPAEQSRRPSGPRPGMFAVYLPPGGLQPSARGSAAVQTRPQRRVREVDTHPRSRPPGPHGRLRGIGLLLTDPCTGR